MRAVADGCAAFETGMFDELKNERREMAASVRGGVWETFREKPRKGPARYTNAALSRHCRCRPISYRIPKYC